MNVSYNWLKELVHFDAPAQEIADLLTRLGHEVESIAPVNRNVKGVLVGKILSAEKHPDADKLKVTKVDIGNDQILNVVCGASNCREGLIVPVAVVGTKIDDFVVSKRKLRGIESEGMILSEKEMGITDDHSGIIELPDIYPLGTDFSTLIEAEDFILTLEITVNRPDALSHLGLAREISAAMNLELHFPDCDTDEIESKTEDKVKVILQDPEQGPRYSAKYVEGVTVAPSPLWMKARLWSIGQRPINNIVDVSNYVLFELGHPLHAFDYHLVAGGEIIVRLAKEGSKFVTLDDQERTLKNTDLLITDPQKAVALAGVMGGANSEVGNETKDILIEAAYFHPITIRKTSKRLGLSTEASRRFERGADPNMTINAARRCARLIKETAGGDIYSGEVDGYTNPVAPWKVNVRPSRVRKVLGLAVSREEVINSLNALRLNVNEISEDNLEVTIPTFRPDLEREIDLIEEVARMMNYDSVPDAITSRVVLDSPETPFEDVRVALTDIMAGLGFREVITSGMVSSIDQKIFDQDIEPLMIKKAINQDMNAYRSSIIPSLLRVVEHNLNRGQKNIRIFETGQVYGKSWISSELEPHDNLAFVVCGEAAKLYYDRKPGLYDIFDMKGDIKAIVAGLSLDNNLIFSYDIKGNLQYGIANYSDHNQLVLMGGLLDKDIARQFGIDVPVYIFETDLGHLVPEQFLFSNLPGTTGKYHPFSRFPTSERDLAFWVPDSLESEKLENLISNIAGKTLESIELFDLYIDKKQHKGERSLAYHLVFRSDNKTLTDAEIDPIIKQITKEVQLLEGVQLRS